MAADLDTPADQLEPEAPLPAERGRYAVYLTPDGGWAVATAGPLCDQCAGCGCGEAYRDPILVPPMVVHMITGQTALPGPLAKMLGKVFGNG